jgi:hypothetical protein
VFGPAGTSTCAGGGCHTSSQSGFACGTTAKSCYTGFVNYGMVVAGANASSQSTIVNPNLSPLCGSGLGGNMPKTGACLTAAQISEIKTWLACGAPDD